MAYKYQFGQAQMSGNLIQEGVIEVRDDAGATGILLDSLGVVSASGLAEFLGVNVHNAGITDAGAISGATNIDGTGDLTMGTITMTGFSVDNDGDAQCKSLVAVTSISGGTSITGQTISADGALNISGLADLNGGIDVNGAKFTVSNAGAVVVDSTLSASGQSDFAAGFSAGTHLIVSNAGALTTTALSSLDGGINVQDNFTVSDAGAVVAVGINAGGAISGATTIAGSGLASLGSLAVDDGSTIGCDTDGDLLTLNDQSIVIAANAALTYKGTAITATGAELNYLDLSAAIGTATASEAVVLNAAKDFAGVNIFEAAYVTGSTFLSGAALALADASGIAGAGLADDGTGKLTVQGNQVSSASLGSVLAEGYNYFDTIGTASAVGLPLSPSVGDVVHFKVQDLLNKVAVTVSASGAHKIEDNATSILIESAYGAVSFFYSKANQWLII
jgi:hypothetical protein